MERSLVVKRIVANIAAEYPEDAKAFYCEILGLKLVMDHGWIQTFVAPAHSAPQISIASEGGSGTLVPDVSVEVDNLDEVLTRARAAGIAIEYEPVGEPWGVKRFYMRYPFGKLINSLEHSQG
jgi:catechol 2,3-dioxygenase-like lactoylglutathione lyase family enzyme